MLAVCACAVISENSKLSWGVDDLRPS